MVRTAKIETKHLTKLACGDVMLFLNFNVMHSFMEFGCFGTLYAYWLNRMTCQRLAICAPVTCCFHPQRRILGGPRGHASSPNSKSRLFTACIHLNTLLNFEVNAHHAVARMSRRHKYMSNSLTTCASQNNIQNLTRHRVNVLCKMRKNSLKYVNFIHNFRRVIPQSPIKNGRQRREGEGRK
jgi:hypothetical protein